MRNGTLVVVLLALVLLLGLFAGGYLLLHGDPEPRRSANQELALNPENSEGGGVHTSKTNTSNSNSNTSKPVANTNTPKPDGPTPPKPDGPTPPKPDGPTPPKPDGPAATTWKTKPLEITITGEVHYKSDNRPAVGVSVSAINSDNDIYSRWGDNDWAKSMRERPAANPKGTTTTDGEGKFTLKLSVTASGGGMTWPGGGKGEEDGAKDKNNPDDEKNWSASFIVVATEPGFAPARSAQMNVKEGATEAVSLILAHPAAVRGRVVDGSTRQGITGAIVEFHNTDRQDRGGGGYVEPRRVVTTEGGYFALNDLPEARYGVSVSANSYAAQDYWTTRRYADLSGGGEKDLGDIALNQTVTIKGRVLDQTTRKPLKATATGTRKNTNRWGGGGNSVPCNDDGTFVINNVEPGVWDVSAVAEGYAKTSLEVTVAAGQNADAGDILLGPGVKITGRVVDNARKAKPAVEVKLSERREMGPFMGDWPEQKSTTKTDEEGRFSLSGLSEGKWQLDVETEGFAPLTYKFEVKEQSLEVELVLLVGGAVRGHVREAEGKGVAGAKVVLVMHGTPAYELFKMTGQAEGFGGPSAKTLTAVTDDSGAFALSNVPPGVYLAAGADGTGNTANKDDLNVRDGDALNDVELMIAAKGTLEVTVLEDGKPAPDIQLTLWRGFMPVGSYTATSGPNGVGTIKDVPEGAYTIRTSRDESELDTEIMKKRAVHVKAGEVTRFTLELKPMSGGWLHGALTMNGRTDAFTTCVLTGIGPLKNVIKQSTVKNGEFEYRGLALGKYELHARQSDQAVPATVVIEIAHEGDNPFSKDFRGYSVSGSITTPANDAAERSQVKVILAPSGLASAENTFWLRGEAACDSEGQFTFDNVATGGYQITASLAGVGSATKEITLGNGDLNVELAIGKSSGKLVLKISKLNGKAVRTGMAFALPTMVDAAGANVSLGDPNEIFMTINEGSEKVLPTIPAGTYTVTLKAMGFLAKTVGNVSVDVGKTTACEFELTAAAEVRVTFTNTDITQEQCNSATISYFDASGKPVAIEGNIFDGFGTPPTFPKPTVAGQYIGPEVAQVKIKLPGYQEITVPVQFEAGKLIASEVTLVQG